MSNIKKFRIKSFKDHKPLLELRKISLKYGQKIILDNLNLKLIRSEILGILGPMGLVKALYITL